MAKKTDIQETVSSVKVIKPFRDSDKYIVDGESPKRYTKGQDVSHFEPDRINELIKRGIVKMTDTKQGSMVEQPSLEPPCEE